VRKEGRGGEMRDKSTSRLKGVDTPVNNDLIITFTGESIA